MIVLGIETSCDETSVALVSGDKRILAHKILSQTEHAAFGGVVPEIAARAHLGHLSRLVQGAFDEAKLTPKDITAVAATIGPGLIGGLLVGATFGKAVAGSLGLPFIGVNHLEGHALSARLVADIAFPFLLLLVSGGHCQILAVKDVGRYKLYGTTVDDAIGEAFDKTAKLLGLGYPGGPALEALAEKCADPASAHKRFDLPRPYFKKSGCDFSLSGLKSAVRRAIEAFPPGDVAVKDAADLACAFQLTVADIIRDRLGNAFERFWESYPDAQNPALVVAGGVAANKVLRGQIENVAQSRGFTFYAPPIKLCSDNAAMIAWAGIERLNAGQPADPLDIRARPRWALEV